MVVMVTVALSACGSSTPGGTSTGSTASVSPEWAATIEAAKKEGTVVVSSFPSSSDTNDKINKQFQKEYGIQVQSVPLTSEFSARYQTELAAGKVSIGSGPAVRPCASLESKSFTQSFGTADPVRAVLNMAYPTPTSSRPAIRAYS
jgi:fatty acid-binding protein DegV